MASTRRPQHDDGRGLHAGFGISPFSTYLLVELNFETGFSLSIHRTILLRSSKLALLCDASTKTIQLRQISNHAGHTMVHYLYTGKLNLLHCAGPDADREMVQLKTMFEVYAVARTYELDGLEDLAKAEIERLASKMDAFALIDMVKTAYPIPIGDDLWFPRYIKSRIKAALRDPSALLKTEIVPNFGDGASVVKIFLGCMLEVYADMLESLAGEPLTPGTDHSFEQIACTSAFEEEEGRESPGSLQEDLPEFFPIVPEDDRCSRSERLPEAFPEVEQVVSRPHSRPGSRESAEALSVDVSDIREYFDNLMERSRRGTPEAQPEPELEAEPEPEPELPVAEPVIEAVPDSQVTVYTIVETPHREDADREELAMYLSKKKKMMRVKKERAAARLAALRTEQKPEPELEKEPEPEPEPELKPEAEPEPEPEPETSFTEAPLIEDDSICGFSNYGLSKKSKKFNKKKGRIPSPLEPVPEPESEPLSAVEPTEIIDPAPELNPWGFWGLSRERRSPSVRLASGDFSLRAEGLVGCSS